MSAPAKKRRTDEGETSTLDGTERVARALLESVADSAKELVVEYVEARSHEIVAASILSSTVHKLPDGLRIAGYARFSTAPQLPFIQTRQNERRLCGMQAPRGAQPILYVPLMNATEVRVH
jgi:hypothetical protein